MNLSSCEVTCLAQQALHIFFVFLVFYPGRFTGVVLRLVWSREHRSRTDFHLSCYIFFILAAWLQAGCNCKSDQYKNGSVLIIKTLCFKSPHHYNNKLLQKICSIWCHDTEILAYYMPISNLPFISKVLEKVVAAQLQDQLHFHGLYKKFHSGFPSAQSTKTALVHVTYDLHGSWCRLSLPPHPPRLDSFLWYYWLPHSLETPPWSCWTLELCPGLFYFLPFR